MKKILFALFGFSLILSVFSINNVEAAEEMNYTNGYLDNYSNYTITSGRDSGFDNNLSSFTRISPGSQVEIRLTNPVEVEVIGLFARHSGFNLVARFYAENETTPFYTLDRQYSDARSYYINLSHTKKLDRITLSTKYGDLNLHEFDFFINELLDPINMYSLIAGFDEIDLTWELPGGTHAVKLYLNNEYVKTVVGNGSHKFENLRSNTNYKVGMSTVTLVDGIEKESLIKNVDIVTNPVPDLPDNLITAKAEGDSIILNVDKSKFNVQPIKINYYLNGNLVDVKDTETIIFSNLQSETEYSIEYEADYGNGNITERKTLTVKTNDLSAPADVTELVAKQTKEGIVLNYVLPTDLDFSHLIIEKDNKIISNNVTSTEFVDTDEFEAFKTYKYTLYSVDTKGNKSSGETVEITTTGQEVFDVQVEADFDYVNLSWENPILEEFETVTIYRKLDTGFSLLRMFSASSEDYAPIFQTNGTVFKDLTVESNTDYTYKLTSMVDGVETEGVTVNASTGEVYLGGSDTTTDENGNYVVTWERPVTGEIKVVVGGEEYTIVPAADQQVIIPKEDMKFTVLGTWDVVLIPIKEDGTAGIPSNLDKDTNDFTDNVELPFTPSDLLNSGTGLFWLVGSIVLLALAFLLVPKLKVLIFQGFNTGKVSKEDIKKEAREPRGLRERMYRANRGDI